MNYVVNNHNVIEIVLITFIVSFLFAIISKKIAIHVGAIDYPNARKIHEKPMPRLGGIAIYATFLFGYIMYGSVTSQMLSILIGSFIIFVLGLLDDIKPIPAKSKLLVQIIAASIVVFYGKMAIGEVSLFGSVFNLNYFLGSILSIFFIVGAINAINLIDGLDGLCAGISSIYFLTIAIISFILNQMQGLDVILCLIMLGSTLGFLCHNFPPAKTFMGDCGSTFLGFMIAVISLLGFKITTITSLAIPVFILAIPIFDTALAILRRLLQHKSIGEPDKRHFHHQLLKMKFSLRTSVIIIYIIDAVFSFVSILFAIGDKKMAMIIYIILMVILAYIVASTDILFDYSKKRNYQDKILGFNIYNKDKSYLLKSLFEDLKNNDSNIIFNINPLIVCNFYKDNKVVDFFNSQKYCIPDGIGIIWASRKKRGTIRKVIPGIELMEDICSKSIEDNYRIFIYGTDEKTLNNAICELKNNYDGINIVGFENGYVDEKKALEKIKKANADILFVGLGSPKQERFIIDNYEELKNIKLIMPVGGSIDVIGKKVTRAPKMIQKMKIEWLYRLIKEPKRLKNDLGLIKFVFLVLFRNGYYNKRSDKK